MIKLYTDATGNGRRVSIMLEETGLPYEIKHVVLSKGEHRKSAFSQLNPSQCIPVIIDQETLNSTPVVLSQSTAILIYLAEKSNKLIPKNAQTRAQMFQWLMFAATDLATTQFDAFILGLNEQKPAAEVLHSRFTSFYQVLDKHLSQHQYLAGNEYSIADISTYPWAKSIASTDTPNITRWLNLVGKRTAVRQGMKVPN